MAQVPPLAQVFFWPGEDALAKGLAAWAGAEVQPIEDLPRHSKGQPSLAVALWRGPDLHLAACLDAGLGVAQALAAWKSAARTLLIQSRQMRRSLILAEAAALRDTQAAALAARLGQDSPTDLPPGPATLPLARAMAQLALHQDADLRQVLDDLIAASLPAEPTDLAVLMDGVAAAHAQDLLQVRKARADRDEMAMQARDLTTQIALQQENLTRQIDTERNRAEAAALQIAALEARIAVQDQDLAARAQEADLMLTQVRQGDDLLARHLSAAQTRAEADAVRIDALEAECALLNQQSDQHLARLSAQEADLAAARASRARLAQDLADRHADLDLALGQLSLTHQSLGSRLVGDQATALRLGGLEGQFTLQSRDLADARGERDLLRTQLDLAMQGPGLTTPDEAAILLAQIDLLQTELTRALMAPPAAAAQETPDAQILSQDADYWDKALARALAAARTEADLRARVERELALLKAAAQTQTRRTEDQAHDRSLFARMTKEAAAGLDEIARLSAALNGGQPPLKAV